MLYWRHSIGDHVIQFGAIPFTLGEKRLLDCQYGVYYKKPKSNSSNQVYLQGTRKKGCPAHIEITQSDLYPEYSVHSHMAPNPSQKQAHKIREELEPEVFETGFKDGVQVTHKYHINLLTEEAHHKCHPT